jgi:diketogulonate reductase-like aldo/keto reductase
VTVTLAGGTQMPSVGLGVWRLAPGPETEQAVEWALDAGYRLVDTATFYRNEQSVGAAIRRSGVPRDELFVTTKLNPIHPNAPRELAKSLKRLGLDYVDLYLIHWPVPLLRRRHWRQLEALQVEGLAREIGVSNYGERQLRPLVDGRPPAVNQVHMSPFHFRPPLLEFCRKHGIVVEAYSPLEQGRAVADPTVIAIGERLGRTAAQVLIRWSLQHGTVVIPRSKTERRIRENIDVFDFELGPDDMATLDQLERGNEPGSRI